jgi:hypothetical protein
MSVITTAPAKPLVTGGLTAVAVAAAATAPPTHVVAAAIVIPAIAGRPSA